MQDDIEKESSVRDKQGGSVVMMHRSEPEFEEANNGWEEPNDDSKVSQNETQTMLDAKRILF